MPSPRKRQPKRSSSVALSRRNNPGASRARAVKATAVGVPEPARKAPRRWIVVGSLSLVVALLFIASLITFLA
ncbi:hypothetical protein EH165_05055 [Nakamurella antarctica]|uniref:Uncharacterized protein n=1 Tax=Nakamurella antarctica TaxID=1902245 RepID=A0A3G8ZUB7_9ACTN|nr:hypothetical protein [Nakamurella antarctica]AZI57616.1 hypothetical protein EH165_05055 [Nakamurella antarctica]